MVLVYYTNTTILRQTLHLLSHKEVTYHPKSVNFSNKPRLSAWMTRSSSLRDAFWGT